MRHMPVDVTLQNMNLWRCGCCERQVKTILSDPDNPHPDVRLCLQCFHVYVGAKMLLPHCCRDEWLAAVRVVVKTKVTLLN